MSSIVDEIVSEARDADADARAMYLEIIGRAAVDASESTDAKRVRDLLLRLGLSADDLQADISAIKSAKAEEAKLVDVAEVDRLRDASSAAGREVLATVARHDVEITAADDASAIAGAAYGRAKARNMQAAEAVAKLRQSHPRAFGIEPTPK